MRRRQSGQAILLFILLIGVAGGLLGLAIDGSRVYEAKRQVQSMADAAAIGAAIEMKSARDEAAWRQAALDDSRMNGFLDESDQIEVTAIAAGSDQDGGQVQDGVQVLVRRRVRSSLMAMFGARELFVSALASATLAQGTAPCVLALVEDGPGALVVEGEGAIRIDCAVEVRSLHPEALMLPDDGCLSADKVLANSIDDPCVSPRPTPMQTQVAAPAPPPAPSCAGLPIGAATVSSEGVVYYWPGCYDERIVIEEGRAELSPGEYVLLDGMEVSGGELTGKDVSLALAAGPLEILDEAWVDLDAGSRSHLFTSGAAEGAARITPRAESVVSGGLSFPARDLVWRPNSSRSGAWNSVAARSIRMIVEDDARLITGPTGLKELTAARPVLIR